MDESRVILHFGASRATDGSDLGAVLRRALGDEGEISAQFDDAGGVAGYTVTLTFEDTDEATEALFRLRDHLDSEGLEWSFADGET